MTDNFETLEKIILNEDILLELAKLNHAYAKMGCPVRNGKLQKSIRFKVDPVDKTITVGSDDPVAKFVEYGVKQWERAQGGPHDPLHPKKDWKAKRETGKNQLAQMPFLRPAAFKTQKFANRIIPKRIQTRVQLIMR